MHRLGLLLLAWCLLLSSGGCGSKRVKITGQLTWEDEPLHGSADRPLRVSFSPIVNGSVRHDLQHEAEVDQDTGAFVVPGGLPIGVYRISIRQMDPSGVDRFKGAYFEGNTPLIRELRTDRELILDLTEGDL